MAWKVPMVASRAASSPDQPGDALAHLVGGLVGEGDGHDLPGLDAGGDQVGDPMGEHPRLAAAGAGQDQQRTDWVRHRLALRRVQALQDLLRRARGRLPGFGRCSLARLCRFG